MRLNYGGIFDFAAKSEKLEQVNAELEDPNVWNDQKRAQDLGREKKSLEAIVVSLTEIETGLRDATDLFEMAREEGDEDTIAAIEQDAEELRKRVEGMEFRRMFNNPMDANNCFIDITAGAGGTEAQDWASMIMRQYLRYCERKGFKTEILEISEGEIAGIKTASIKVEGDYAYGFLRTETGVHRLVRKSPFDSANGRHTSFCSLFVYPEVDDSIEIDINPADVRVDTYRASGAGGQHINKTDSAVRLTHLPTGIVVECQDDRSQHKNKAQAMKVLAARIKDVQLRAQQAKEAATRKSLIGSGDRSERIRTYNFPQGRMTDHRINLTLYKLDFIMDGDLEELTTALAAEHQAEMLAELAEGA